MPVFHFTLHAYRSWNTDNPRGYIKRGKANVQPPDEILANARNSLANWPPFQFTNDDALFLIEQSQDVVTRRKGNLYAITIIESHIHLVAGWKIPHAPDDLQSRLKQGFGFLLAKRHNTTGRPYFSRGGAPEQVKTKSHFDYLFNE